MSIKPPFENARDVPAYDAVQIRRVQDQLANEQNAFERQRSGAAADTGEMARETMTANASNRNDSAKEAEDKRKAAMERAVLFNALHDAQAMSDQLAIDIGKMEDGFEGRYGDAWREVMANRIMDPDDIPERKEGESMEDYRERLEKELIDELLDEDGNIKPEYANDPEMYKWGQWAQKKYDKQDIDMFIERQNDHSIPQEQRDQERSNMVESNSYSRNRNIVQAKAAGAEVSEETLEMVAENTDMRRDMTANVSAEADFMSLG